MKRWVSNLRQFLSLDVNALDDAIAGMDRIKTSYSKALARQEELALEVASLRKQLDEAKEQSLLEADRANYHRNRCGDLRRQLFVLHYRIARAHRAASDANHAIRKVPTQDEARLLGRAGVRRSAADRKEQGGGDGE